MTNHLVAVMPPYLIGKPVTRICSTTCAKMFSLPVDCNGRPGFIREEKCGNGLQINQLKCQQVSNAHNAIKVAEHCNVTESARYPKVNGLQS